MAFNLKNYLTNFQFDSSVEGLKEASDTILKNSNLFDMIGQSSPVAWAGQVQMYLKNIADIDAGRRGRYNSDGEDMRAELLNDATRWLSGGAQPRAASSFQNRYRSTIGDIEKKIANDLSNIANVSDIPANTPPEERAALLAKAQKMQDEMAPLLSQAQALNIPVPTIKRIESGFIPASEATMAQGRTGAEQEATTVQKDTQGNYDIVGAQTGRTLADNVSTDLTQALAIQNQRQLESTPSLAGRPDLYAVQPTAQEMQPGYGQAFTPYVGDQGQTVTPQVATLDQINQLRNGTLQSFNQANPAQVPVQTIAPTVTTPTAPAPTAQINQASTTTTNNSTNELISATETLVQQKEQAAAQQGIQVTEEMRGAWLQEAMDELKNNRYYQEVIRNTEFDLGTSLNRLVQDTRAREMAIAQDYKQNLKSTQSGLQNRGMLYGGVRQQAEQNLADQTNFNLNQLGTTFQRGLQDTSLSGERNLGSSYVSSLVPKLGDTNLVGRVLAGSPVFQTGGKTNVFQYQGGNYGDLTRSLEEQARVRAGEKESTYRDAFSTYQ